MQFDFIPSQCQGEQPTASGKVVLSALTFDEKYDLLDKIGLSFGADEQPDIATFKNFRVIVKASEAHYVSVDLKKGDKEYQSFADLQYDDFGHSVLMQAAMALVLGKHP